MRTQIIKQHMSPFEGKFFVVVNPGRGFLNPGRGYLLTDGTINVDNTPRVAGSLYYFDTREEAELALWAARIKGVVP